MIVFLTLSVFLFAFSKQSMAQEKRITIQKRNISLKDAFNEIEKQTDYSIAYKKSETNEKQRCEFGKSIERNSERNRAHLQS